MVRTIERERRVDMLVMSEQASSGLELVQRLLVLGGFFTIEISLPQRLVRTHLVHPRKH